MSERQPEGGSQCMVSAAHLQRLLQGGQDSVGLQHLSPQEVALLLASRGLGTTGSPGALLERLRASTAARAAPAWDVAHLGAAPWRSFPALVAHEGDLYLLGGAAAGQRRVPRDQLLLKYNAAAGAFEGVTPHPACTRPRSRAGAVAVVRDGQLWLWGGEDGYQTRNDMWVFDFASCVWRSVQQAGEVPTPRAHVACALYRDLLVLYGYEDDGMGVESGRTVKHFDFSTRRWGHWRTHGDAPADQKDVKAVALVGGCLLYVLTLRGSDHPAKQHAFEVFVLDISARRWTRVAVRGAPPSPRVFAAAAPLGQRWILHGGLVPAAGASDDDPFTAPSDDVYEFNFDSHEWSRVELQEGQLLPRAQHTACALHGSVVFVGGSLAANASRGKPTDDMVPNAHLPDDDEYDSASEEEEEPEVWGFQGETDVVQALRLRLQPSLPAAKIKAAAAAAHPRQAQPTRPLTQPLHHLASGEGSTLSPSDLDTPPSVEPTSAMPRKRRADDAFLG